MDNIYNWNNAFVECMTLKHDYINAFGVPDAYCFKEMVDTIKQSGMAYHPMFDCIKINQKGNLVLIKYDLALVSFEQWNDPNSPLRESRSLVFDVKEEEIVLCPFKKFFNLNEIDENSIDNIKKEIQFCKSFEISDKLDGSMQSYRYYNGEIVGSGSQSLDVEKSFRLKEGFSMLTEGHKHLLRSFPHITFIFEYISAKDKHIVPYDYNTQSGLYLIGARNVTTGEEWEYDCLVWMGIIYSVETTRTFAFQSLDEVLDYIQHMTVRDGEGVVLDIDGHKVKIKNSDYLQLNRLDGSFSSTNVIIKAYADGTIDDLYSHMGEVTKEKNKDIINEIERYINTMEAEILYYQTLLYQQLDEHSTKTQSMKIINNFPREIREYVRQIYLGNSYNVLKSTEKRYKKIGEIRIIMDNLKGGFYE